VKTTNDRTNVRDVNVVERRKRGRPERPARERREEARRATIRSEETGEVQERRDHAPQPAQEECGGARRQRARADGNDSLGVTEVGSRDETHSEDRERTTVRE